MERVMVREDGFAWNGTSYASLSAVAFAITGTKWNGYRFFGLRNGRKIPGSSQGRPEPRRKSSRSRMRTKGKRPGRDAAVRPAHNGSAGGRTHVLPRAFLGRRSAMKGVVAKPLRCAIYTRVSTDHGLEQEFNSLDAQREAAQAYIKSQAHEGWRLIRDHYDDGGFSGGSLDRPACRSCSPTSGSAGSTSWSSTRSIA